MTDREYIFGVFGGLFWACFLCADYVLLIDASVKESLILKIIAFVIVFLMIFYNKSNNYIYFVYKKITFSIFFVIILGVILFVFGGIEYINLFKTVDKNSLNSVFLPDLINYISSGYYFSVSEADAVEKTDIVFLYNIIVSTVIYFFIMAGVDIISIFLISFIQKAQGKKAKRKQR